MAVRIPVADGLLGVKPMSHSNISIFVPHLGCPHRCSFCDQNAITGSNALPDGEYVKALLSKALDDGLDPASSEIAFFGGSFTAIPREYMLELLESCQPFLKQGFQGIRLSTRPDCVSYEILDILRDYGVRTVELGAQSMDDSVLLLNERGHTSLDVELASSRIKEYGIRLGLQMMVGLYGSTKELDILTAKRLIALNPDEARIYPVAVMRGTTLGRLYESGEYRTYPMDEALELLAKLLSMFSESGIPVIKLGLHSSVDVESRLLGGIYHPALRELCESLIYRRELESMIEKEGVREFTVPKRNLSSAIGHKKSNLSYFREKGIEISIKPSDSQTERLLPAQI